MFSRKYMTRKAFFKERTKKEIKELKFGREANKHLIERILNLDKNEGVRINTPIIPLRFLNRDKTFADAARLCYKHGEYIPLSQPQTLKEALELRKPFLSIRAGDLDALRSRRQEDIAVLGYSFFPVQGHDRLVRRVPFYSINEGTKIYTYSKQIAPVRIDMNKTGSGIDVKSYADARKVEKERATMIVNVPSRTEKKPRYNLIVKSVPVFDNPSKNAIALGFKTKFSHGADEVDKEDLYFPGAPGHDKALIRYTTGRESSDTIMIHPHEVAAMLGIAEFFSGRDKNQVPWDMNPFAKPARLEARIWSLMGNNVLVRDPYCGEKDNLRKPYVAERSILAGKSIGLFGYDSTMWHELERDGKFKDYPWQLN